MEVAFIFRHNFKKYIQMKREEMKKRRISVSLGRVISIIIILIGVYFALRSFMPFIVDVVQNLDSSESNRIGTKLQSDTDEALSYEEVQMFKRAFPNIDFKGKIYYNIYGKKILETDRVVDFSDTKVDENLVDELNLLTDVAEVGLYNQELSNDEKIALQELFPKTTFKWTVKVIDENIDYNVEELDLSNKKVADLEEFKKSLNLLPNLKKLDMSYTNLSNEELGNLRELFPNIKIDWVVFLGKWSLRTDAVAFSVLVTQFDYRRMTSDDIQVLKYCTELQALDIGHQAIEDISVIGDYLPNLRVLILADNRIKDISPIAKLKHLHYLELFMNDITDVSPLSSCNEIVDLNICFNYRFSNIDPLLNFPLLERLWLISDNISADSYRKIRETYPNVVLVTVGSGSTNSGWRGHERYFTMIDMYRNNYISDLFLQYDNK